MILVDSSVWIAHLQGRGGPAVSKLDEAASREPLLVGDLILLEVLQGARNEAHAAHIERALRQFAVAPLLSPDLAPKTAQNYRTLRDLGITIRNTADLIIGTFCIEHRHTLLHDDRDFDPMQKHLGLEVV